MWNRKISIKCGSIERQKKIEHCKEKLDVFRITPYTHLDIRKSHSKRSDKSRKETDLKKWLCWIFVESNVK